MNELSDIAKTAGYDVVKQVTQHRDAVDVAFCVGEGKIDEIAKFVRKDPVEAVIFTGQLSAGQVFRIKKKLGEAVRVLDRNLLILDVFDKRGASAEAKLQVLLARLRYTFSWGRESIRMRGIVSEQMGRGGPGRYQACGAWRPGAVKAKPSGGRQGARLDCPSVRTDRQLWRDSVVVG